MKQLSSLAWALHRTQGALPAGWSSDGSVPAESQLVQACADLGLAPPRRLRLPDASLLPLLCRTESRGWGVVTGRTASGLWVTSCESGGANFSEFALVGACFAVGRSRGAAAGFAPTGHPAALAWRRTRLLGAALCMPTLPSGSASVGFAVVMLLAMGVAVACLHAIHRVIRRARPGGWTFLSRWAEAKRLATQQERIQRQAILARRAPRQDFPPHDRSDQRESHDRRRST